jgi:hypothetical protein
MALTGFSMIRVGLGFLVLAVALTGGLLSGCSANTVAAPTAAANVTAANPTSTVAAAAPVPSSGSVASGTMNRVPAPTISGTPATTAVVGQTYSFQPHVAKSGSVAVSFSIAHAPAWAKFNTATGQLSGTPASNQVGQYAGIVITMRTGQASVALPAFTVNVAAASNSTASNAPSAVTLSWEAPTENADGSPLLDLQGYKLHIGSRSESYSDTIQVSNPGLTTYVVQNLPAGQYYFAITAYNSAGQESIMSPEIATMVN